jgi:imidazole glycerol phosphate synthase glutamine amidotransferase subunit
MNDITIVATGAANLASLSAAFARLGCTSRITADPRIVAAADRLVLPGVGAFGPAMARLEAAGLADAVRTQIATERPFLGICLGMQLLFEASDEAPGVPGLGVLDGRVERFSSDVDGVPLRVPHVGWSEVSRFNGSTFDAYFSHSYRVVEPPAATRCGFAEYGGRFVAMVERGALTAVQFHPELSGRRSSLLLVRALDLAPTSESVVS